MIVLLTLLACGDEKDGGSDFPTELVADYETWNQPDGWSDMAVSCDGTHGPYVDIFYNADAEATLTAGTGPFPDGAALVKVGYKDDLSVGAITAMVKQEGFDPDHGDWTWAQFDADMTLKQSGALSGCAGCHAGAALDYVLFPESAVVADAAECP